MWKIFKYSLSKTIFLCVYVLSYSNEKLNRDIFTYHILSIIYLIFGNTDGNNEIYLEILMAPWSGFTTAAEAVVWSRYAHCVLKAGLTMIILCRINLISDDWYMRIKWMIIVYLWSTMIKLLVQLCQSEDIKWSSNIFGTYWEQKNWLYTNIKAPKIQLTHPLVQSLFRSEQRPVFCDPAPGTRQSTPGPAGSLEEADLWSWAGAFSNVQQLSKIL